MFNLSLENSSRSIFLLIPFCGFSFRLAPQRESGIQSGNPQLGQGCTESLFTGRRPSRHGGGHAFAVSADAVSQAWPDCWYHFLKKGNSSSHEAAQAGITAASASWLGRPTIAAMASTKSLPHPASSPQPAGAKRNSPENNTTPTRPNTPSLYTYTSSSSSAA